QRQLLELGHQRLRLRLGNGEIINNDQTLLTHQLGQDATQRTAVHLAVHLLRMIQRHSSKRLAAATPKRATNSAGTGTTSALLAPRLLAAATYLRARLLGFGTLARTRQICRHNLMYQRLVEILAEGDFRHSDGSSRGSIEIHPLIPLQAFALTAGRTITLEPGAPGTAPLISSRFFSASTRTTSRFWTVTRSAPMWPAIFLPLNTRPGLWFWPMEPGARCDSELPWVASCMLKFQRLITPWKPLPFDVPVTSTIWPASKISAVTSPPTARSPAGARNSPTVRPA